MAGVPQKTLNWLYDVLKREYHDPNRTYSDLAQTLAQYPGLSPRTEVYTSENGAPALLLTLKGTLPANFRGTIYRFPIAVWIPHAYPHEAPIAYVTPTEEMVVRPGQHVSASDGKIYHHYLARWREAWDRSSVIEFLKVLANIFAKEPPVMARSQRTPSQQQPHRQSGPPPLPPHPQDQQRYNGQPPLPPPPGRTGSPSQNGPPPPPPKQTGNLAQLGSVGPPSPTPRPSRYDAPPPLPQETSRPRPAPPQPPYSNNPPQQAGAAPQYMPQRTSSLRQEYSREQPPIPQHFQAQSPSRPLTDQRPPPQQQQIQYGRDVASPPPPPTNYNQGYPPPAQQIPQLQGSQSFQPGQQPPGQSQRQTTAQSYSQPQPPPLQPQNTVQRQPLPPQAQPQLLPQFQQQPPLPFATAQAKPTLPKDLLSENDPFQVALPATESQVPAPPIPINPEKTALLTSLSHIILQHLHTQVQQTYTSALPSLSSQHAALTTTSQTLTSELHQLQTLSSELQSNINALQTTIQSADTTISATQDPKHPSHPDNIPAIDQIIIPPTVVARQLYDAVAEQRGYEAAIFALNDAFVRGRVSAEIWGRKVRECAREEMRRKWLVRKIGDGLGLEEM